MTRIHDASSLVGLLTPNPVGSGLCQRAGYCALSGSNHRRRERSALVGQAVVIDGENIVAVVPEAEWQGDAVCQRMEGITLLPGLINGHEHPLIYGDDYQGAHLAGSSAYKALLGLSALQSMLQHGWTTVRVMGDADVFYGVLDVRRAIEEGVFDGPRMTGAAHYLSITGGGGDVNYLSPEQRVIADGLIVNGPMEVRKAIREEIKYGSDWIKILVTGAFIGRG